MIETVCNFSGHANSGAMTARLINTGNPPDAIMFADTGLEFDEVYDYLDKFERHFKVEIIRENIFNEKPEYKFENFFNTPWCRGKKTGEIHGMPKTSYPCWHHRNIKERAFNKYKQYLQHIGYTVEERHRILKGEGYKYPLIEWQWTSKDSIKYLRKIGLPHILYDKYGFERLGCCICPYQKDDSLKIIYKHFPKIWDYILDLEDRSPHGFRVGTNPYELMEKWDSKMNRKLNAEY